MAKPIKPLVMLAWPFLIFSGSPEDIKIVKPPEKTMKNKASPAITNTKGRIVLMMFPGVWLANPKIPVVALAGVSEKSSKTVSLPGKVRASLVG